MSINKDSVFAAFNAFANQRVELIQSLKVAGVTTVEEARPYAIEWACAKTGAAFTVKANGAIKLVSSHRKYESAKTVVRDLMLMIQGTTRRKATTRGKTDPVQLLLTKFESLTAAEKRRFLASI